jgi:hypothetical protein
MKKVLILILCLSAIPLFGADRKSMAQDMSQRHSDTIAALEQETSDIENNTNSDSAWSAFYQAHVKLFKLEDMERRERDPQKRRQIHEQVVAAKRDLDTAASNLK